MTIGRLTSSLIVPVALALTIATTQQALSAPRCTAREVTGTQPNRTTSLPVVRLRRITGRELLQGRPAARRVRSLAQLRNETSSVNRIERRIPQLWFRRVPVKTKLTDFLVEYRVTSRSGANAEAIHRRDVSYTLPVIMRPIEPRVHCHDGNFKIVTGGVVIELPLVGLPVSGRYQLQVESDVRLR